MKVTVVIPRLNDFASDDHPVRVFEGELSRDEVLGVTSDDFG